MIFSSGRPGNATIVHGNIAAAVAGLRAPRHPVLGEGQRQQHRPRQARTAVVLLHVATDSLRPPLQNAGELSHHQETR